MNTDNMEKILNINKEICEPIIITAPMDSKIQQVKAALTMTKQVNANCCLKLKELHHLERIKRVGMMNLLEEVIEVQAIEEKINMTKEKQIEVKPPIIKASNTEIKATPSPENKKKLSGEKESKELAAAGESIENLTKSTFNKMPSLENLQFLMIKFARPEEDTDIAQTTEPQTKPTLITETPENIVKIEDCNITTISKKRERHELYFSTPIMPVTRNKKNEKQHKRPELPNDDGKSPTIKIGSNGTTITRKAWNTIKWSLSGPAITRKILTEVFGRSILAFHSLTGKPSPAFGDCYKPKKHQLNTEKVADIIEFMTKHFDMTSREVRSAITTKCADENKMHRQREQKIKNRKLVN